MPKEFIITHGLNGSGKDTICMQLHANNQGSVFLSAGEIFRASEDPEDPHSRFADILKPNQRVKNRYSGEGPMMSVMETLVRENYDRDLFLFSGFPRSLDQLKTFEEILGDIFGQDKYRLHHIFLQVREVTAMQRIAVRRKEFIEAGKAPRGNDSRKIARRRFEMLYELTMPILIYTAQQDSLIYLDAQSTKENVYKLAIAELRERSVKLSTQ